MQKAMYSALFGSLTQEFRLNMIANNLANANTTGYKRDKVAFEDVFLHFASDFVDPNDTVKQRIVWPKAELISETRLSKTYVDFSGGSLKVTGNPLDLAIEGKGFFKIQTDHGIRYTRDGRFSRDPKTGYLVTLSGYKVLGENGPIQLPEQGKVIVNENGEIIVNNDVVDKIAVVDISDLKFLQKEGKSLFYIENNKAKEVPLEKYFVRQGCLETSNVQPVKDMVNMIEILRSFESLQKVMQTSSQEDEKAISQVGVVR
ncbi:MAG: flagellar basal-body rod protein FlgF [Desulfonauticus sp.]|nr:flagellar basal-body rod protein FlgF [Desulfonauticus sp.]